MRLTIVADETDRGGQYHWCSECTTTGNSQRAMTDKRRSCTAEAPKVPVIHRWISLRTRLARLFGRHLLCCRPTSPGYHRPRESELHDPHLADCLARVGRRHYSHLFQYRDVPEIAYIRGYPHVCSCLRILCIHCRPLVCIMREDLHNRSNKRIVANPCHARVMAPRGDSSVLTTFSSNGWSSSGVASLVGISAAIGDIIGADSSVHLAEELKNAAWILPRSMIATAVMNYVLGFITISISVQPDFRNPRSTDSHIVTLVLCLGNLDNAINSPTGQPYVEVLLNATQSRGAAVTLTTVMLILLISCAVNTVTTSSRQLWSFARDGGPPFSAWLARVRPAWDM